MRLHILHRDKGLKSRLDPVMPGAVWDYPDPNYLPKAKTTGKGDGMLRALLAALQSLPQDTKKVSSRWLKGAMGLDDQDGTKQLFTSAVNRLGSVGAGWSLAGRSLVRAP